VLIFSGTLTSSFLMHQNWLLNIWRESKICLVKEMLLWCWYMQTRYIHDCIYISLVNFVHFTFSRRSQKGQCNQMCKSLIIRITLPLPSNPDGDFWLFHVRNYPGRFQKVGGSTQVSNLALKVNKGALKEFLLSVKQE
jgi:hypothetical protein